MEILGTMEWEHLLRIGLAVVLGGIIGLEREFAGRPAGLRTHILVCLGSTLIVLASTAIPRLFGTEFSETLRIDPGRIAAGIVTGIGFLGAGAIIRTEKGSYVRGLTTAACIWFAAALGIVIGEGFYFLAICGTVTVFFVLRLDQFFDIRISSPVYRTLQIRMAASQSDAFESRCRVYFKEQKIRLQDVDCTYEREGEVIELKFYLRLPHTLRSHEIVNALRDEPGLVLLRWQN